MPLKKNKSCTVLGVWNVIAVAQRHTLDAQRELSAEPIFATLALLSQRALVQHAHPARRRRWNDLCGGRRLHEIDVPNGWTRHYM